MSIVFGFHLIEEYILAGSGRGRLLVAGKGPRTKKILELASRRRMVVSQVSMGELDSLCGSREHRGLALEIEGAEPGRTKSLDGLLRESRGKQQSLLVVLDGITDPQNMGAIIRSCDQFGVDGIIIPKRRSAGEGSTVGKTSAGALSYVQLVSIANLERGLRSLQEEGYWICGADMEGESITESKLPEKLVLVMGSEGKGMSRIVKDTCDSLLSIPMRGHVDSLNVSVATGILLYEIRRQQGW